VATSQAEVSRSLRETIREMVHAGKSNQEIYSYIEDEYGPGQIAIPHQGYFNRLSYGLPYLAVGTMILISYWMGWNWWMKGSNRTENDAELSDEQKEQLDSVTDSVDSPLN